MKTNLFLLLTSLILVAGVVGCSNKDKAAKNKEGGNLTDVPPAPAHQPVAYQAPQQQPVTPVAYEPMPEPVASSTPAASGGNRTYKVQKGDTLWGIAAKTYGDGKQYRKIVAANPGIKGEKVMVGQTIVLP